MVAGRAVDDPCTMAILVPGFTGKYTGTGVYFFGEGEGGIMERFLLFQGSVFY